jgi:hypothetical protein
MAKLTSITFRYDLDSLFTIAIDQDGLTYRVLCACGGTPGDTVHYHLSPWAPDNARTSHRGHWIKASSPWLGAIRAAEQSRPRAEVKVTSRFAAEWV